MESLLRLCRSFAGEVLEGEEWFLRMVRDEAVDLLLFTGSVADKTHDALSDHDLYLVCSLEAQNKYRLKPVQTYEFRGVEFEVSVFATEKLFNDRYNKNNIEWWHNTYVVRSYNAEAEDALHQASRLSEKELLDRIWTNYVLFEIFAADLAKQSVRQEPLSVRLLFGECIKRTVDTALSCYGEFPSAKWFGTALRKVDDELYDLIIRCQNERDISELRRSIGHLRTHIVRRLEDSGFTPDEIENWESCNLTNITFQYR